MKAFINLIRVKSWLKNVFIIFPLVFSLHLSVFDDILKTLGAFFLFSFASTLVYIINDILDAEKDKLHPRKKFRPVASGKISIQEAWIIFSLFLVIEIIGLSQMSLSFCVVTIFYLVLNIAYSFFLKNFNIVEFITIAFNFVLRVIAGCIAIAVIPSHWIVSVTFFIALFLILIKRKSEILLLQEEAVKHRQVLKNYSISMLDKLIFISATITITSYLLYTIQPETIATFKTDHLFYSTIFILMGIIRFIQLSDASDSEVDGDPTFLLYKDLFIQIVVFCWISYIVGLIYLF